MKKIIFSFAACAMVCMFATQNASARTWRVNLLSNYDGSTLWGDNFGGNAGNPVFSNLTEANGSALVQNGDSLHVEGSISTYEGVYLTKRLTVVGPGFLLTDNANTSNDLLEAKINYVVFLAGSNGSSIIGLHIVSGSGVQVDNNMSNITVKRCRIDYALSVSYASSDIFVIGNFFNNINSSNASAIAINGSGFPVNFIFNNNICQRTLLLAPSATITYSAVECKNNVFDCPAVSGSPSIKLLCNNFQNNILKTPGASVDVNANVPGSGVSYNISASSTAQFGTVNNNIVVADQTTLFITSTSTDGKYQLKPASQASNNGSDGTDRGAYGGASISNHYTLSGLAPIPVIYDISTSGVSDASGLPVTIRARTIK